MSNEESKELEALRSMKRALGRKVEEIQMELTDMAARVRGGQHVVDYPGFLRRQADLRRQRLDAAQQISRIKPRIMALENAAWATRTQVLQRALEAAEHTGSEANTNDNHEWNKQIVAARDKWLSFAKDATRVSSMRQMAAAFASDLTEMLTAMGLKK